MNDRMNKFVQIFRSIFSVDAVIRFLVAMEMLLVTAVAIVAQPVMPPNPHPDAQMARRSAIIPSPELPGRLPYLRPLPLNAQFLMQSPGTVVTLMPMDGMTLEMLLELRRTNSHNVMLLQVFDKP